LRLRFLNKKNAKAEMVIAATPRPAPRPAARAVLLLFELVATTPVGDEVPEAWPAAIPPVLVVDVAIVFVMVLEEITDVEAAVEAPVF
jgi:hypothetical protein